MDASDAKAYIQRWDAVAEIERQEQQGNTITDNWRQLNAIKQRAIRLGITRGHDDGEMELFMLWAKIKAHYVVSKNYFPVCSARLSGQPAKVGATNGTYLWIITMSQTDQHDLFHDPLHSLERLLSHVDHRGVIIGGIAVSLLGQARFTEDLDAMVLLSIEEIPHFLKIAQQEGIEPRISQAEEFARRNRVLLLHHLASQTNIDISLGILPFEQEMVARSEAYEIDEALSIRLPTPEDLIIMKAIAHRPKDLLDIQGIIQRHPQLDRERIQEWVTQFADLLERPELWDDIARWLS